MEFYLFFNGNSECVLCSVRVIIDSSRCLENFVLKYGMWLAFVIVHLGTGGFQKTMAGTSSYLKINF